ncbi:hypothetical protein [Gemmata sp.]|uniref:hypothetical protein n=1 Tax=Gemmata sp. TaxID=1914242 RepID=UPI003F710B36
MHTPPRSRGPCCDRVTLGIVAAAAAVSGWFAIPYAGGYSDGSRLAAIESVGARGTLAIDDSVFVGQQVSREGVPPAYDPALGALLGWGTGDKMFVGGQFYSHHPPVPLLAAGALYRGWLLLGLPPASRRPDLFATWVTIATACVPYAVAVGSVGWLARREVGLPGPAAALLTLSIAAATCAPAYSRQVTGHVLLLAVGALACVAVARSERLGPSRGRSIALGTLAGAGYALDGALGPALVLCVFAYVASLRWRSLLPAALAAAPWAAAHHLVLYAVTGDALSPASDPKNWAWGSPFNPENLTGGRFMHTPLGTLEYLAEMLVGPRGFLSHNLPLALAPAAAALLAWRCPADRRAVVFACGWVVVGAAPYVLCSNNHSGTCLSVRWFVPFLAPGFWLVALLLRRRPECAYDLAWLTLGGLVLGYHMFLGGPWRMDTVPYLNLVGVVAVLGWGTIGVVRGGGTGDCRGGATAVTPSPPRPG